MVVPVKFIIFTNILSSQEDRTVSVILFLPIIKKRI